MYNRNLLILKQGYAPSTDVAKALQRSNVTIHRMAETGRLRFTKDGRALFIHLSDAVVTFEREGNPSLASAMRALAKTIREEVVEREKEAAEKGEP